MSNIKDDEIKLIVDDFQEIEDYTVDVEDIVNEEDELRRARRYASRRNRNKKAKRKKKIKIVLLVFEIFVVLMLGLIAAVMFGPKSFQGKFLSCAGKCAGQCTGLEKKFNEKYNDNNFDDNKVDVNDELELDNYKDYITVALFGIDSRHGSLDVGLSDSILIATLNTKTKEARLCSIYRDTYLSLIDSDGDISLKKINEAFSNGGVELALTNLNRNLDIKIDEYAVVNFGGLATIIDAFGGIDVNITADERYYINGYLQETRKVTGMDSPDVKDIGWVHLNGLQATAFCRIRYVQFTDEDGTVYNNDFGRTARQRYVIRFLINKAKQLGIDNVTAIANELFGASTPAFKTSMTYDEIMDLLPVVIEFSLAGTEGFPYTLEEGNKSLVPNGASVLVAQGLEYNVTRLHKFLYPDESYKPTTTLKNISNDIAFRMGVDEHRLPEDE